jgi:hypothetical protein
VDLAGGTAGRLIGGEPPLARPNPHPLSDSSGQPADQVPIAECSTSRAEHVVVLHWIAHLAADVDTRLRQPECSIIS